MIHYTFKLEITCCLINTQPYEIKIIQTKEVVMLFFKNCVNRILFACVIFNCSIQYTGTIKILSIVVYYIHFLCDLKEEEPRQKKINYIDNK